MAKFLLGAALTSVAATAIFATSANAIEDMATCMAEGGSSYNLQGTNVCLVPIRDKEWSDPVYDGNQLGIIECTGRTINNGTWCMEPFGDDVLPAPVTSTAKPTQADLDAMTQSGLDAVTDAAVDAGTEIAADAVQDAVEDSGL